MLLSIRKGKRPWVFCFNPQCPTNKERIEEYRKKKEKERNILKDHESRMEKFEQFRKELGMPDVDEKDFGKPFKHNFPNANIVTNNYDEKDKPHDVENVKRIFRDLSK